MRSVADAAGIARVDRHGQWSRILCVCWLVLACSGARAESLQSLMPRLEEHGVVRIADALVYDLPVTQEFYARNDFDAVWTDTHAVHDLAMAIRQTFSEGMNPDDYHQQQVEAILDGSLQLGQGERDLLLTDSLVRLLYHYALGKLNPAQFHSSWNFHRELPQVDPVDWLDRVIRQGGITSGLDALKPAGEEYQGLIAALARYRALEAAGGWLPVADGPTLRIGDSGPRVEQLRQRLQAEGELVVQPGPPATAFDADLEQAVKQFQRRHRLDVDGAVGRRTLAALNVPVSERIGQIRVNLERARVLQDIPATAVIVDIAGFEVSYFRDGERLLRSRAQVGRPYRSTPVFRDTIRYVEFNPSWTVPPTILEHDVLPEIRRDPGYLERRNMLVLDRDGAVVDPADVDWSAYPARAFPYRIRQLPGPENALGRVKVMFPNEHLVFLHDTPSQNLFKRSERTFSSGCIRVEQIERLVELLLDDPRRWDRAAIDAALESGERRRVDLAKPVPVYLVYWTVAVEEDGEIHFKHDPYDRDLVLLRALERPLVPDAARVRGSRSTP